MYAAAHVCKYTYSTHTHTNTTNTHTHIHTHNYIDTQKKMWYILAMAFYSTIKNEAVQPIYKKMMEFETIK